MFDGLESEVQFKFKVIQAPNHQKLMEPAKKIQKLEQDNAELKARLDKIEKAFKSK